jgi:hypothetical protein
LVVASSQSFAKGQTSLAGVDIRRHKCLQCGSRFTSRAQIDPKSILTPEIAISKKLPESAPTATNQKSVIAPPAQQTIPADIGRPCLSAKSLIVLI